MSGKEGDRTSHTCASFPPPSLSTHAYADGVEGRGTVIVDGASEHAATGDVEVAHGNEDGASGDVHVADRGDGEASRASWEGREEGVKAGTYIREGERRRGGCVTNHAHLSATTKLVVGDVLERAKPMEPIATATSFWSTAVKLIAMPKPPGRGWLDAKLLRHTPMDDLLSLSKVESCDAHEWRVKRRNITQTSEEDAAKMGDPSRTHIG